MRTKLILFLVFISFCAVAQKNARVTRVKDGDTFVAVWNGKAYSCRLSNIDAPELSQAFGVTSKDNLSNLILGKVVALDSLKKDLYGRVLVDAWIDGMRLDSLMIRKGWAWYYTGYSKDLVLSLAMEEAVSDKLGLWSCGTNKVCPPWLYRHYNYRNRLMYCKGC